MMNDSVSKVVIKKSLPKILVRAFIWLLSLFVAGAVYDYVVNRELRAENKRIGEVNEVLKDSLANTLDSLQFQVTVVGVLTFENDSLRERTGPIRWRTVFRDTGSVRVDSFPVVIIDSQEVRIPIVIAEELESCRALAPECEKLKVQVDSLLVFIPTVIDSLEHQIAVQDEIINGPKWNIIGLKIPRPRDHCGLYGGYRLTGGSGSTGGESVTFDDVTLTSETSSGNSRWAVFVGCGVGFNLGIF